MNKAKELSRVNGKKFLQEAFAAQQKLLLCQLQLAPVSITHDGIMGDTTEQHFIQILRNYLPRRYAVDNAIVIDSRGATSHQIDIVVYDIQYTPTLLDQHKHRFVPAEAVYAILEVKSIINKLNLDYAAKKAESVRQLHRTSVPIPHAGGEYPPKPLFPIISGIIAPKIEWEEKFRSTAFQENHSVLIGDKVVNCGLAVEGGCFDTFDNNTLKFGPDENSLAYFIFRLLQKLQTLGTVPAIDWNSYALALSRE